MQMSMKSFMGSGWGHKFLQLGKWSLSLLIWLMVEMISLDRFLKVKTRYKLYTIDIEILFLIASLYEEDIEREACKTLRKMI